MKCVFRVDRELPPGLYSVETDRSKAPVMRLMPNDFVKQVIFNPPATIVLWADGTKTVVRCAQNDIFDPEKGLAMAIAKKSMGGSGSYYDVFKKWVPEKKTESMTIDIDPAAKTIADALRDMADETRKLLTRAYE